MTDVHTTFLYVSDPTASAAFYAKLLGRPALEASPNFALHLLAPGHTLGLWARHDVKPTPATAGEGTELGFKVDGPADVDRMFAAWTGQGVGVLMPPTDLDFGRSFVGLDPDGHRLRVYCVTDD